LISDICKVFWRWKNCTCRADPILIEIYGEGPV